MLPIVTLILLLATGIAQDAQDKGVGQICPTQPLVVLPGDSNRCIMVDGLPRTYILHIPPGYTSSARLPLVFVLHGMGGEAESFKNETGMSPKADKENFIVVYPQALPSTIGKHPTVWNTNLADVSSNGVDDVGFIRALMDKLEHDLRIDGRRIYCSGFSSGANMSYLLGAKLSHRLAAIGIVSGTVGNIAPDGSTREIPTPSEPVPVIAFHGKKDPTIFYNGGGSIVNCLSVADSIAFWVKADGCASPPHESQQGGDLIIDDYGGCKDGSEVTLYSFEYGKHEWPTLNPKGDDHFSATEAMWTFFVSHPRR
jgi:polyhydroxybutyrate depolymerase